MGTRKQMCSLDSGVALRYLKYPLRDKATHWNYWLGLWNFKGSASGDSSIYSKSGNMTGTKMLESIPSFIFYNLTDENYILSRIVKVQKIDLIISDNRYGIINKKTKNILLLHQLQDQPPANAKWIGIPINQVNKLLIRRFDECWIPDYEGDDNLGGILSHPERIPSNVSYIGPLSRLDPVNDSRNKKPDSCNIVRSGT